MKINEISNENNYIKSIYNISKIIKRFNNKLILINRLLN